MEKVESILREQNVGITEPYIAQLRNSSGIFTAFIKVKGNPEGVLCLVNELVSYRLASIVGLTMPASGVAVIDADTSDNTFKVTCDKTNIGSCFFSTQIEKGLTLNQNAVKHVDNDDIFEKIILFDHLIYNKDRNLGNLLLSSSKSRKVLYAIDHTHVFKNQAVWDSYALERGMNENDYMDTSILESNGVYDLFFTKRRITFSSLQEVALFFQSKFKEQTIENILEDLPQDWAIEERNLVALRKYLLYRLSHLLDMCRMITDYWKLKND